MRTTNFSLTPEDDQKRKDFIVRLKRFILKRGWLASPAYRDSADHDLENVLHYLPPVGHPKCEKRSFRMKTPEELSVN